MLCHTCGNKVRGKKKVCETCGTSLKKLPIKVVATIIGVAGIATAIFYLHEEKMAAQNRIYMHNAPTTQGAVDQYQQ